jgi:hypothetical protein
MIYVVLGGCSILDGVIVGCRTRVYSCTVNIWGCGTRKLHHSVRISDRAILLDFVDIKMSFALNFWLIRMVEVLRLLGIQIFYCIVVTARLTVIAFIGVIGLRWKSCHSGSRWKYWILLLLFLIATVVLCLVKFCHCDWMVNVSHLLQNIRVRKLTSSGRRYVSTKWFHLFSYISISVPTITTGLLVPCDVIYLLCERTPT